MVPMIIGALGYVPNDLKANLEKLNFNDNEIKTISRKLQTISVSETVKIVKTFIGFKMQIGPEHLFLTLPFLSQL